MSDGTIYAVMTGDIVRSSKLSSDSYRLLLPRLKSTFKEAEGNWTDAVYASFGIFRGDAFQGVLCKPQYAARMALWIRCMLRQFRYGDARGTGRAGTALDARIAVGIGTVGSISTVAGEGWGEAFNLSGAGLEAMKSEERLSVRTPWPNIDEEVGTECALLDALMSKWSPDQAEAVGRQLTGITQQRSAEELGISQPAVAQRQRRAGGWAVERFCRRFEWLISEAGANSLAGDKS